MRKVEAIENEINVTDLKKKETGVYKFSYIKVSGTYAKKVFIVYGNEKVFLCWLEPLDFQNSSYKTRSEYLDSLIIEAGYKDRKDYFDFYLEKTQISI